MMNGYRLAAIIAAIIGGIIGSAFFWIIVRILNRLGVV